MGFQVNDIIEATDRDGNYSQEKGVVVGFKLNSFHRLLVEVKLECNKKNAWSATRGSVFYPNELTLVSRPEKLFPEK